MIPAKSVIDLPAGGGIPLASLTPTLYRDLRMIASRHLRSERPNHTLQPTALVHEAYLKLAREGPRFADEVHLFAVLSRVMRQVLVDYARSRVAQKRQGPAAALIDTIVQVDAGSGPEMVDIIALDHALAALAEDNERLAQLIEMRYFGGMTAEESAEALGISVHVVRHDLRFAQAWLQRRMRV